MILAPDDRLPDGPARWTREALSEAWASERRALKAALADPSVSTVAVTVGIPASGKSSWARDHDQPGLVIFDACWAEPGRRAAMAKQIRAAGKVAVAVWIRTPLDVCRERNAARPPLTRVPDVALARAWVALQHHPPTVAEGWSRVLVQDGQAARIHDAALTPEQQLARAAQLPADAAWKALSSKVLPALRAAEPGTGIPPAVERELVAMERALGRSVDNRIRKAVGEIGTKIETRERTAWDQQVTKAIGEKWAAPEGRDLVGDWYKEQAERMIAVRSKIVPGLRQAIEEARAKGWTVDDLEATWKAEGLPLDGYGTAEGRGRAAAQEGAGSLAQRATKAAQEAAGSEWYEWGPTTSRNPDPAHAALRGKRFRWSDPPAGGHPGERWGCHCKPVPVLTAEDVERLKPKAKPVPKAKPEPKPVPKPVPAKPTPKPAPPRVVAAAPKAPRPAPPPRPAPKPAPTPKAKAPKSVPAKPKAAPKGPHGEAMSGPLLGTFDPKQIDYGTDERGAKARQIVDQHLGKGLSPEERDQLVASLISAHPSAVASKVSIRGYSRNGRDVVSINADLKGGDSTAERTLEHDPSTGELTLKNNLFTLEKEGKYPPGYGTRALRRQMEAAHKLGIERIVTAAAGGKGRGGTEEYNGFYTWPRLGYDGPVPATYPDDYTDAVHPLVVPPELMGDIPRDKLLVSDIMATAKGRAWWKENGTAFKASFDPRPGSRSMQVLDAYMKERGL